MQKAEIVVLVLIMRIDRGLGPFIWYNPLCWGHDSVQDR